MQCQNCKESFDDSYSYCPFCSQKAVDKLTITTLFRNTINNYFSVDSRIFKSLGPLLFKPGFLPMKFIEGQRLKYIHPAQFYLFISVIFFFFLSFNVSNWQAQSNIYMEKAFKDTSRKNINKINSDGEVLHSFSKSDMDSLVAINAPRNELLTMIGQKEQDGFLKRLINSKILDFYMKKGSGMLELFYGLISIALFVLIPLFALLLKLLFWKRKPYSHHLVFSFSFFTFLFLLFIITYLVNLLIIIPIWGYIFVFLISIIYLIIAEMRFYNTRVFKTLWITLALLFSYITIVLPFSLFTMFIITILIY